VLEPGSQRLVRYARVSRYRLVYIRGSVFAKDYVDLTIYSLLERPIVNPATPTHKDQALFWGRRGDFLAR
jgi:hypothetical protein